MKRKMILALLAAMTLTVGSVGTVFAAVNNGGTEIQTTDPEEPEQHTHTWGDPYYVIDQEAKYEKVEVIDQEEKWDWVTNIITPAWDEEITEIHTVCFTCGLDFDAEGMSNQEVLDHQLNHMLNGESGQYGSKEVVVDTIHHEAVTEDVWTKVQDKISHFEDKLISPEKGHWEHTCADCGEIQNSETGEVIKPGTLPENPDTDTPENPDTNTPENPDTNTPENPDTDTPENPDTNTPENPDTDTPENPDTDTPENPDTNTPETPDTDTPETPGESTQTPENDSQNQQTPEDTQAQGEETADTNKNVVQGTEVNQEASQPETSETSARKSPKTGDPANFIYLATLVGSALTGGTAFGLKKKFKK